MTNNINEDGEKMDLNKKTEFYGIIPARYDSTRLPGKPLADICGKPMIWHVYNRALKCNFFKKVVLATDDDRIYSVARSLDIEVVMTKKEHPSGSDRVLEAAVLLNVPEDAVVVNIQGDEPLIEPDILWELVRPFDIPGVLVTTPANIIDANEAENPDRVKIALSKSNRALYFSRSRIPFSRNNDDETYYGHIGLYAFRMNILQRFVRLEPGRLEEIEKLEQLRLLENDIPIQVVITDHKSIGVDSQEDLERVVSIIEGEIV